jgi:hypothetical protein
MCMWDMAAAHWATAGSTASCLTYRMSARPFLKEKSPFLYGDPDVRGELAPLPQASRQDAQKASNPVIPKLATLPGTTPPAKLGTHHNHTIVKLSR